MNTALHFPILLADRGTSMFRNMGNGFRQKQEHFNPAELLLWLALLVGAFVVLNLVARWLARRDKQRLYHSPRALFRALCRAHEIDAAGRRLLKQLAAARGLQFPAQVFLQPDCFDGLGPALRPNAKQIAALRQKLFGPRIS